MKENKFNNKEKTKKKYKCIDCNKLKNLVKVKTKSGGYANRCLSCYKKYWKNRTIKTNALKEINKIAKEILK